MMASKYGSQGPCHRCGRGGHIARDCNLQTCFRCNGRGHMAWECGEGMKCSSCGEMGHLQRNCKNVSCRKCGRRGHISRYCSDPFAKAAEAEKQERERGRRVERVRQQESLVLTSQSASPRASVPYSPVYQHSQLEHSPKAVLASWGGQHASTCHQQALLTQRVRVVNKKRKVEDPDIRAGFHAMAAACLVPQCEFESLPAGACGTRDYITRGMAGPWEGLVGYETSSDSEAGQRVELSAGSIPDNQLEGHEANSSVEACTISHLHSCRDELDPVNKYVMREEVKREVVANVANARGRARCANPLSSLEILEAIGPSTADTAPIKHIDEVLEEDDLIPETTDESMKAQILGCGSGDSKDGVQPKNDVIV